MIKVPELWLSSFFMLRKAMKVMDQTLEGLRGFDLIVIFK
jgi:hypothetical protein